MSTCPEKDLHSIYLDGELPENFLKEYESHVASCEKCQAELEKMRRVSAPFREDALSVKLDKTYLDESFERLQTKMRFARNTARTERSGSFKSYAKWITGFAAAAAVFAVIVTPVYLSNSASRQSSEVMAIARTQIKPLHENKVVVDDNLDKLKFSTVLGSAKQPEPAQPAEEEKSESTSVNKNQKVISATSLASGGNNVFSDIDFFRPDFNNSPASVRMEMRGMPPLPVTQAGNFEGQ